jgi:O-antigen/teichoic acid export membrane protein
LSKLIQINNVNALQLYQILRQGALILIAVLLANSTWAPATIGSYEMLLYLAFVLTFFWITGLTQGLLTLFSKMKAQAQDAFFLQSFLLFSGLCAVIVMALWAFKGPILQLLTGQGDLPHYNLFLCYLFFHQPTYLLEHFYLLRDRPSAILWLGAFTFVGQISAVMAPAYLGFGLGGSIAGLVIFGIFRYGWLLVFLWKEARWQRPSRHLLPWLSVSLPLILYALLGGFHQAFDNWLVGFHYQGDEYRFAVFRYGARELPFALALANAFGTAFLPRIAADTETALIAIREKSRRLFHGLFPLSIFLMLTSSWWFPFVFSEAFRESVPVFNIFLLIMISRLVFARTVLMGLQDNRIILWLSFLELLLNVGLSFLLIPVWGLEGIAMGTVGAFTIDKALLCWLLYRRHGIALKAYTDLRWFLGYSLLMIAAFIVTLRL